MKLLTYTLLSATLFASACGTATEFSYFGIGVQHTSYRNLPFGADIGAAATSPLVYEEKDSATGIRGFWGYQFNNYLGLESGLSLPGKAKFSVLRPSTNSDGKAIVTVEHSGEFKTVAADIRGIVTYPFTDNVFLTAHLAAVVWNNSSATLMGNAASLEVTKNSSFGMSLQSGIGAGYGFSDKVALVLAYETLKVAKADSQTVTLSLLLRF